MKFNHKDTTIVRHLAGSQAYGTNIEGSDEDIRGIFAAPVEYIRSPFYTVKEVEEVDEEDTKLFELTHFMELFMNMNPNIVETLFVDDKHILQRSDVYDHLRANAHDLLSKKAAFTFSGYALAQLKRIKGHNKWINNPQPKEPPRQTDFVTMVHNFTNQKLFKLSMYDIHRDYRLIPYGGDLYGVYECKGYTTYDEFFTLNTNSDGDLTNFYTRNPTFRDRIAGVVLGNPDFGVRNLPKFIIKFNREQYKEQKTIHKNYWNWVKNRNAKRNALEEEFGYDTKHAMHLVRLLRMGEEILTTGEVHVSRPDANELLDIRNGAWKYDELVAYAEDKDKLIRGTFYKNSPLRKTPNIKLATKVLMEAQDLAWSKK